MSKVIHYDDNIFFIALLVKALRQALALEIDPDVFKEKYLEELNFIDQALIKLFAVLKDNERLLERSEHLKNLLTVKKLFIALLDEILAGGSSFAQLFEAHKIRLLAMKDQQGLDISAVYGIMSQKGESAGDIDVVSQDELSELFKISDEEEGEI